MFMLTIVQIGIVPRFLGSFIESCCCHAHVFQSHRERVSRGITQLGDGLKSPCINAGCRGPKLIAGVLQWWERRLKKACPRELKLWLKSHMPPAALAIVFHDYELAISHLDMHLSALKLLTALATMSIIGCRYDS